MADYTSKYTGVQIDNAVAQSSKIPAIESNVSALQTDKQNKLSDEQLNNIADIPAKANSADIPTQLPNPFGLTINGEIYNGSEAVEMTIEGGGVEEAPTDGKQYARQNGAWSAVSSSGGSYDDTEVRSLIAQNSTNIEALGTDKADKTEIPDVSGLATKTELSQGLSGKQDAGDYALASEIPTQLPNPFNLTINGTSYDGSKAVEMTIEGGGGGSSNAVLYTPQTLTQEQKNQVSMNTGFAQTDLYAEWEAGNYNSSGQPIDATIYYVRSKPVPVSKLIVFPTWVQPSRIVYFDENGNVDGTETGQAYAQYFIPNQTKHSVAFSLYVSTAQGGSTSESKIAWAKGTAFKNSLMPIPIKEEEYIRPYTTASSLTLKCAQEFNADESPTVAGRYLWIDEAYNFYISDTLRGEKKFAFAWALPETPDSYSMAFYGNDILAVYATATNMSVQTENIRRNPYVLVKDSNYSHTEVNFTDLSLAPSNWFANLGYWHESMTVNRKAYFCEYTRPSVQKAYVWSITGSPTTASSWKRLYEKDVTQNESNTGFKHFHHIQKDPYSDWVYFTTGDDEANSYIYGSTDGLTTTEVVYGPNQEYCRLLNFIFTKDAVYWASDNPVQGKHSLFKAARLSDGKMDVANAVKLHEFDHTDGNANATYCLVYMVTLNCLVVLDRADSVSENTPIYVYDLDSNQMKTATAMEKLGASSLTGFRCTYYSTYPQDNTIAVGYSQSAIAGFSYPNPNKILTNDFANVANLLLNVYRTGSGFGIGFETIR